MSRSPGLRRRAWMGCIGAAVWGGAACTPPPPLRIGFLGGLANQASSFSLEGRNGVLLAFEQRNLAGGVAGRRLELVVQDYGEAPGEAVSALRALMQAGVVATIGPYSSVAAAELEPLADQAQALLLSPISRPSASSAPGNYLLRVGRVRRDEAQAVAGMLHGRGIRRIALASDLRSAAYSKGWSTDFRDAFSALGGTQIVEVPFGLGADISFAAIARDLLATRPDGVLFVSSSVDAARLAQQVAQRAPGLPMTASGRAINDALLELGGQAVEGMVLVQPYNAGDTSPRYRAFRDAYLDRFGQTPTYSAMVSFDAATVLAEALARRGPEESPRDAVLRYAPYQGLQDTIRLAAGSPAPPKAWFSIVRHARFEPYP